MHLVIYGPEGSGKGTQAKLLSDKLGIPIYTAGDLVRWSATNDEGYIGDLARKVLGEGTYLSDTEMCQLLEAKIKKSDAQGGFILDGFPRSLAQAQFIMKLSEKLNFHIDRVIYLKLGSKDSILRLVKRKRKLYSTSNILHDDPERIKKRLKIYKALEKELLDFYKKKNLLLEIDGSRTIEEVHSDIVSGLRIYKG